MVLAQQLSAAGTQLVFQNRTVTRRWAFEDRDRYLPQPNQEEIGIKERGDTHGLEFKGLVATRRNPALSTIAGNLQIWCKWSCVIPDLKLTSKVTITKTRWLRQFDTSEPLRVEIPLDSNEKPKFGYVVPVQGCNVELTEVRGLRRSGVWWTPGFEAFGDLDTAPINLTRVILPERSILGRDCSVRYAFQLSRLAVRETRRLDDCYRSMAGKSGSIPFSTLLMNPLATWPVTSIR